MKVIDISDWDSRLNDMLRGRNEHELYDMGYFDALGEIDDWMDAQPDLDVDAVSVVRCEDCYCWDRERTLGKKESGNMVAPCSEWSHQEEGHTRYTLWNGFCSYGERREDDETD